MANNRENPVSACPHIHPPAAKVRRTVCRESGLTDGIRAIPEETAVAITYNGGTSAVMMATPQNLDDFAVGFTLSEDIINAASDIRSLEILAVEGGVEARMWLDDARAKRLSERRRRIAGPTGCGLCGIESITEAMRPAESVESTFSVSKSEIMQAMRSIAPLQKLNIETRAVHAAAYWTSQHNIVALREDVGRHNALDKLAGALAISAATGGDGMVLLTSRISVEMVQKTAAIGAPVMVSISAPTALAVRMADAAGITLAAIARDDGFEIFSHPNRIIATHDEVAAA